MKDFESIENAVNEIMREVNGEITDMAFYYTVASAIPLVSIVDCSGLQPIFKKEYMKEGRAYFTHLCITQFRHYSNSSCFIISPT